MSPIQGRQRINAYNVFILLFVGLGSVTYGYTASIIGTTLGQPSFIEYFELDHRRKNSTDLIATTNGLFQAGGVIGTLLLPNISDRYGRKWGIAIAAILAIISGAVLAGSTHIAEFIFFRFIAGAAAFMALAAIPIWMNEVVPVKMRAGLVDIHAVFLVLGYTVQGWVGFGFYFWTSGQNSWRPPLALQCAWPLLLLAGLYWIPESPRWLIMKDRVDEARTILNRLHSDPSDPNNDYASTEFYQIQKQIIIDRTLGSSWVTMFRKPSYRKRAFLAIGTTFFIQCSGVLVINNYGPTLYKTLGFSPVKQLLYPAAWLTLGLATNAMAIPLVDRFPRNKYIATGILTCMVCLVIEAALVANFVPSENSAALQAAVAMFFLFQLPYSFCLDGTQFAYLGELFPTHLRAKGVSLGVAVISLTNIVWLQAAPVAFINIGWKFYLVFIIPSAIGGVAMWFWFPDTNGLPLEEIAAIFGDEEEVAVYQAEINIQDGRITDLHTQLKGKDEVRTEDIGAGDATQKV
ncbi:MFS transporter [Massarina eburnea CBS 473.64]|uniref:MFS transporter n=1 Tax=Massarina eburnea CBS 473.64 TaxID=1395130 RepID=A0A6A6S8D0_9PLEO|nr:MFS transporter [Massarina eburnea CBS 473.64]